MLGGFQKGCKSYRDFLLLSSHRRRVGGPKAAPGPSAAPSSRLRLPKGPFGNGSIQAGFVHATPGGSGAGAVPTQALQG